MPLKIGRRVFANLELQTSVQALIAAIDFWLPVVLGALAAAVLWHDAFELIATVYGKYCRQAHENGCVLGRG
jgi:hypothetical protein